MIYFTFVGFKDMITGIFDLFFSLRPSNGGQDCTGVNHEYQLCNIDDCPKHFEDFRAQQCQRRNSHFEFQDSKHHWMPYEHPDGKSEKNVNTLLCSIYHMASSDLRGSAWIVKW